MALRILETRATDSVLAQGRFLAKSVRQRVVEENRLHLTHYRRLLDIGPPMFADELHPPLAHYRLTERGEVHQVIPQYPQGIAWHVEGIA